MKRTFSFLKLSVIFGVVLCVITGFNFSNRVTSLQLDLLINTVNKGKKITTKGELYYEVANSRLVTHFTYPKEIISIANGLGEMQTYDVKNNTLIQKNGAEFSSKQSVIYYFMNGKFSDMGLQENGFELNQSKIEDNLVITTWKVKSGATKKDKGRSVELVHENRLPIYMSYSNNDQIESKTYFTNYQLAGDAKVPMNVTEIQYANNGLDSIIIRKKYTNLKVNNQVNPTYLNFKIPASARLLEMGK